MAEENLDDDLALATPAPKASKQNPVIPVVALLIGAAVISVALAKFVVVPMIQHSQEEALGHGPEAQKHAVEELNARQRYTFDDITTNIGGGIDPRYVRVSFTLEGTNPNFNDVIANNEARVKDAALSVLQSLTVQETQQLGIKNIVASALASAINTALQPAPEVVESVYFSTFIIQ